MNPREEVDETAEVLRQVIPDDLVEYGMIPELVGRVPVITTLDPLGIDALVEILTKPKNALLRQYEKLFEMENCRLEFTPEALQLIAEKAMERDTGARALRAVVEEFMLDAMFELPEQPKGVKYTLTDEIVRGDAPLFTRDARRRRESA
jgi:ATP-dependent Clp protease ATP-binding subunit ClpX